MLINCCLINNMMAFFRGADDDNGTSKNVPEPRQLSIDSIKNQLIDLDCQIQNEIKRRGYIKSNHHNDKINDQWDDMSIDNVINDIKTSVMILINIKANKTFESYCSTEHNNGNKNNNNNDSQYEKVIKSLEAEIQWLHQRECELKLANQILEDKINSLVMMNDIPVTIKNGYKEKDEKYLILQAENSNLKATIAKYESFIQFADQKEQEANEEFTKETNRLMTTIASLETQLINSNPSHHHHKSVHSNSNLNINSNNDLSEPKHAYRIKQSKSHHDALSTEANDHINSTQRKSKSKTVEGISHRKPRQNKNQLTNCKKRIQSLKGFSALQSKEASSGDIDDETASPSMKQRRSKRKYTSKLSENGMIDKDYFLNAYIRIMNMQAPRNIVGAHRDSKDKTTRKDNPMSMLMLSPKQKRSSSISMPSALTRQSHNSKQGLNEKSNSKQTNKNIGSNVKTIQQSSDLSYKVKRHTTTNVNTFKNPKSKDKAIFLSSATKEKRKPTTNSVTKK